MSVCVVYLIDIKVYVILTLMTKFPLGALLNGEYCLPCNAEKGLDYICPGCKASVILRRGEIKAPHFAHKPGERRCEFYDHPGEGEIHKMTKHIIADLLRKRKIRTVICPCPKGCTYDEQIKYEDGDEVIVEYRVSDKCIVDVAVVNKEKVRYVFEIYNTHKTIRETPEPWFEVDAKEILKKTEDAYIYMHCIRRDRYCSTCVKQVNDIDIKLYITNNPSQDIERTVKVRNDIRLKCGLYALKYFGGIIDVGETNAFSTEEASSNNEHQQLWITLNKYKWNKAPQKIKDKFIDDIFKIWNGYGKCYLCLNLSFKIKLDGVLRLFKNREWETTHTTLYFNNDNIESRIRKTGYPKSPPDMLEYYKSSDGEIHGI
jgi:ferredoxin